MGFNCLNHVSSVYQVWKCPEKVKRGGVDECQCEEFQKEFHFAKMKQRRSVNEGIQAHLRNAAI